MVPLQSVQSVTKMKCSAQHRKLWILQIKDLKDPKKKKKVVIHFTPSLSKVGACPSVNLHYF